MNRQKNILNIEVFLDEIDPKKTINREDAIKQISAVILAKAVFDMGIKIKSGDAIEYIKSINKFDEFLKILDKTTDFIRKDYIKTQTEALSDEKRGLLFAKYPTLKTLFES